MKPSSYLINTARGPIVDEDALLDMLQQKKIAGAGLDTYSVEPLPVDHPIRKLDNVVLTPHLGYVTEEAYRKYYGDMVEDILGWIDGKPVRVIGNLRATSNPHGEERDLRVSNHEAPARATSFETLASQAPRDEELIDSIKKSPGRARRLHFKRSMLQRIVTGGGNGCTVIASERASPR